MEPISTLALVTALFAPAPLSNRTLSDRPQRRIAHSISYSPTDILIAPSPPLQTQKLVSVKKEVKLSRSQSILLELTKYSRLQDGWDGEDSVAPSRASLSSARIFLSKFPPGLTLPKPMLSSYGEIGFYWDLCGGYADIQFKESGVGSFFSKDDQGGEKFVDDLNVVALERRWFYDMLGVIDQERSSIAA